MGLLLALLGYAIIAMFIVALWVMYWVTVITLSLCVLVCAGIYNLVTHKHKPRPKVRPPRPPLRPDLRQAHYSDRR